MCNLRPMQPRVECEITDMQYRLDLAISLKLGGPRYRQIGIPRILETAENARAHSHADAFVYSVKTKGKFRSIIRIY